MRSVEETCVLALCSPTGSLWCSTRSGFSVTKGSVAVEGFEVAWPVMSSTGSGPASVIFAAGVVVDGGAGEVEVARCCLAAMSLFLTIE